MSKTTEKPKRPHPPADVTRMPVEHVIPPDHEVVLPRGTLFRAFRTELLQRFATQEKI